VGENESPANRPILSQWTIEKVFPTINQPQIQPTMPLYFAVGGTKKMLPVACTLRRKILSPLVT
jgi:hypothetical protein